MNNPLLTPEFLKSEIYLDQTCMIGNINKVKELIKNGANIARTYSYENKSPLYWACSQDRLELVQYLLTSEDIVSHPKAEFSQEDILSLFKCERINVLDYLIMNNHLIYNQTLFVPLNEALETMGYSKEENVDKLQSLLTFMISSFERNKIETSLEQDPISLTTSSKNNNKLKL
jgi:hypothetical protein